MKGSDWQLVASSLMLLSPNTNSGQPCRRNVRDSGHLLLAVLLMVALMVIALAYEAPRIVQQLKRDREEEMIHRGTEYARAVKKYYKKFGAYPTSVEQLENTNHIRFLRKRYKDPLTKDGKWTLLHYTDVATTLGIAPGTRPNVPGTQGQGALSPGQQGSSSPFGSSTFGGSSPATSGGFGSSTFGGGSTQPAGNLQSSIFQQQQNLSGQQGATGSSGFGSLGGSATSGDSGSSTTGGGSTLGGGSSATPGGTSGAGTPSTTLSNQQSLTGQTFGAGAILGVASKSKDPTIRIYNKKKTYDEWQFIYNPVMDQANVLLKGPYSPSAFVGSSNIGTPAGQLNQQNQQQSPFGQQGGSGTQPQGGYNNQPTLTPGGQQFPPDQNH